MGGGHAAIGKYRDRTIILKAIAFDKQLWFRDDLCFQGPGLSISELEFVIKGYLEGNP